VTSFDTTVAEDGATVIRPIGHLDMLAAADFKALVASVVQSEPAVVVVDLSEVEFVDSSGLGAIISGLRTSREAGSDFRIAGPRAQVRTVLELTSIDRILPPYVNLKAALGGR
jgi:anti-sigma B factor antagonist